MTTITVSLRRLSPDRVHSAGTATAQHADGLYAHHRGRTTRHHHGGTSEAGPRPRDPDLRRQAARPAGRGGRRPGPGVRRRDLDRPSADAASAGPGRRRRRPGGLRGDLGPSTTTGSAAPTATATLAEIPDETAGPYPGDGSNGPDVLTESGIVRGDIRSSFGGSSGTAAGVPMQLELTITDLAGGKPFSGAAVYVWHCNREGGYSLYSEGIEDQNYLRGVQIADDAGRVTFTSIFPALCRALATHPLRGLPGPGVDQRRDERRRHLPGRSPAGRVRAGVRPAGLRGLGGEPGAGQPDERQRLRRRRRGEPARHGDRRRHIRVHGRPRRRCRHHHGADGRATARRRRRPVRRAGRAATGRSAPSGPPPSS